MNLVPQHRVFLAEADAEKGFDRVHKHTKFCPCWWLTCGSLSHLLMTNEKSYSAFRVLSWFQNHVLRTKMKAPCRTSLCQHLVQHLVMSPFHRCRTILSCAHGNLEPQYLSGPFYSAVWFASTSLSSFDRGRTHKVGGCLANLQIHQCLNCC